MNIKFPERLACLFQPKRLKVLYGGRGSGKSWAVAMALLILGVQKPLRILCTREVQRSIKDSVHRLLCDQIQAMGLGQYYDILENEIRGKNGTLILFSGLAQHTVESIKSFEGVSIVWCEEAQAITKRSWDVLTPTIRQDGSEIWITLNPDMYTDETYTRFVLGREVETEDSFVIEMNWKHNLWFPSILEKERMDTLRRDPENYDNIWEGKPRAASEGAIYTREIGAMVDEKRYCNVDYDPGLKVHVVLDLGWNDSMSLILVQKHLSSLRIIEYIEDSHHTLDWYSAELYTRRHNWGQMFVPHDGNHGNYFTGNTAKDMLEKLGWDVRVVPQSLVETGIRAARMALARTYIDSTKAVRLMECLRRYKRGVPLSTGEPGPPVHDEYSHGADAMRYLALVAEQMTNETYGSEKLHYPKRHAA